MILRCSAHGRPTRGVTGSADSKASMLHREGRSEAEFNILWKHTITIAQAIKGYSLASAKCGCGAALTADSGQRQREMRTHDTRWASYRAGNKNEGE